MKILKKFIIVIALAMVIMPFNVKAEETYKTLNLEGALKEEGIDYDFSNYKETDDQVTVYVFRGKGCGYCHRLLEFLNSIVDDYGKYFKVVSYEVWYNEKNAALMSEISNYLNEPADGVPYIIIGDKVFGGYSERYDDEIKSEIKKLYDTEKSKRYDVMEQFAKNGNNNTKEEENISFSVIIFNVIFAIALSLGVFFYDRNKRIQLEKRIIDLESQLTKKTTSKK